VSLTSLIAVYPALELDGSWTEIVGVRQTSLVFWTDCNCGALCLTGTAEPDTRHS